MQYSQHEMVQVFREQLELCALKSGETFVVLSEGTIRRDYAEAFLLAARDLGVEGYQVNIPPRPFRDNRPLTGRTAIAGNRAAIEALKQADLLVDVMGMLFSHEQDEICATGTRILFVREPFDILARNFPTKELRRRVEYGESLLGQARKLRIFSDAGTDCTFQMGGYRVMTQYGYTDKPGRWDHMGTGQVLSQAWDGKVEGTVVIQPGDILNCFRRNVENPITLTIRDGAVKDIAGPGMDAALLRDFMASFRDERAYAISHIGWGLLPSAHWYDNQLSRTRDGEIGVNNLSFFGNVLFSLGPNTELGGTNDTACHVDIPLRDASLELDGRMIVDRGRMAVAEMAA